MISAFIEQLSQNKLLITASGGGVVALSTILFFLAGRKKLLSKNKSTDQPQQRNEPDGQHHLFVNERLALAGDKYRCILFAAGGRGCLPLTIPLNTALELASKKKRCLLIDLDLERDAVAQAFEITEKPSKIPLKPVKSSVENLWLWPAHNFSYMKQMNIKALATAACGKFDYIIINAPSLDSSPDRKQIVASAQGAFVFTKNAPKAESMAKLIRGCGCTLLGSVQASEQSQSATAAPQPA